MKTKLFKRIGALFLACIMLVGLSTTTFAAEASMETEIDVSDEATISVQSDDFAAEADIPAFGTVKFYLNKPTVHSCDLHVSTYASGAQGVIIVTAVNSNKLDVELSNDWVMGTTDEATWKLITMAGTIIVTVNNHSPNTTHARVWI